MQYEKLRRANNEKIKILQTFFYIINTNAIIPVSSRGAKKIPSLRSERAEQSREICRCEERSDEAISNEKVEIAALRSQRRIATPFQGSQ